MKSTMKSTLLAALLLAPLAALHAVEPVPNLHPYVTAGDPNIGRAFRIASGDQLFALHTEEGREWKYPVL